MRFRRRQRIRLTVACAIAEAAGITAPSAARVVHPDGQVFACDLIREPARRGHYRWLAVLPDGERYDPRADSLEIHFAKPGYEDSPLWSLAD